MNIHSKNKIPTVVVFYLVMSCFCWVVNGTETNHVVKLETKSILYLSDQGRYWTIEELEKIARSHVWGAGKPPATSVEHVTACFEATGSKVLCTFTYSGKMGKPVWEVKVGTDGKVIDVFKATLVDRVDASVPTNAPTKPIR